MTRASRRGRPGEAAPADERRENLRATFSYVQRVRRECERTRLMCQRQWEMIAEQRELLRRLGPPRPEAETRKPEPL